MAQAIRDPGAAKRGQGCETAMALATPALAIILAAAPAGPVGAESALGCDEGGVHRMIGDWHGERRAWVDFYSANVDEGFLFDRWTLLHCPTGVGVGVRGFAPFPYPSDNASAPPRKMSAKDRATFTAIHAAVDGQEIPAGQAGAAAVAARLEASGVKATVGKGDRASCVCDPMWNMYRQ